MRNPFRKRLEQQVVARRQVRQEQAAAYDPSDPVWVARNKAMADRLRNTPEARAARARLKH